MSLYGLVEAQLTRRPHVDWPKAAYHQYDRPICFPIFFFQKSVIVFLLKLKDTPIKHQIYGAKLTNIYSTEFTIETTGAAKCILRCDLKDSVLQSGCS
jgi:hypothetical protein